MAECLRSPGHTSVILYVRKINFPIVTDTFLNKVYITFGQNEFYLGM